MPFAAPAEELIPDAAPAPVSTGFSAPADDLVNDQGQTPFDAAHAYLHQAGDRLPTDINPALPYEELFQQFYGKAKPFHDRNPVGRLVDTLSDAAGHPGQSAASAGTAIKDAAGTLAGKAWEGLKNVAAEDYHAVLDNPLTASPRIMASAALGGAKGIYELGKLGGEGIGKVYDATAEVENLDGPDKAAEARARRDFMLRYYNTHIEAPAVAAVDGVTPLPATAAVAENVVPLIVPVGAVGEAGSLAARGANLLARGTGKAAADVVDTAAGLTRIVQHSAPYVTPVASAAGAVKAGVASGQPLAGVAGAAPAFYYGVKSGQQIGTKAGQIADGMRTAAGKLTAGGATPVLESIARPVFAAGQATAIGTGMGIAGAPSGSEGEGAAQGAAFGVLAAPFAAAALEIAARRQPDGSTATPAAPTSAAPIAGAATPRTPPTASAPVSPSSVVAPAAVAPVAPAPAPVVTASTAPVVAPEPVPAVPVSQARADAQGVLVAIGMKPATARLRLDAAQIAGVADTPEALVFFAQNGRAPRTDAAPPLAPPAPVTSTAPPTPTTGPVAPISPASPAVETSAPAGSPLTGLSGASPARAEAFAALTRGDRYSPADANVRLNAAEAAGIADDAAALLDFARTGQKKGAPSPAPAAGKPLAFLTLPDFRGGFTDAPSSSRALASLPMMAA